MWVLPSPQFCDPCPARQPAFARWQPGFSRLFKWKQVLGWIRLGFKKEAGPVSRRSGSSRYHSHSHFFFFTKKKLVQKDNAV